MMKIGHRTVNGFTATALAALMATLAAQAQAVDLPIPVAELERDEPVDYQREVLPLMRRSCLACHNNQLAEGGLNLESVEEMLDGGDSGPAVIAGDVEESLLMWRMSGEVEPLMPPEDNAAGAEPLSSEELGLISLWIEQGAAAGTMVDPDAPEWQPLPENFRPIYAIDVSPDGRLVASGHGNRVLLYDAATHDEVGRLVDPELPQSLGDDVADVDLIQAITFSPDGQRIASGGYRSLKLWAKHFDQVNLSLTTSVDEDTLASDLAQRLLPLRQHGGGGLLAVLPASGEDAPSTDGPLLAAAGSDRRIVVWRQGQDEPLAILQGHQRDIVGLALADSADRVASLDDGGRLVLWDLDDGQAVAETELDRTTAALAASGDLSQLAVLDGLGAVHLLRLAEQDQPAFEPHAEETLGKIDDATAIDWLDADQPLLLVATGEQAVLLVDPEQGNTVRSLDHGAVVELLAVDAAAGAIATAGRDGQVKVWEAASGELQRTLRGDPTDVRLLHDGEQKVERQAALLARLDASGEELDKRLQAENEAVDKAQETRDESAQEAGQAKKKQEEAEQQLKQTEEKIAATQKRIEALNKRLEKTTAELKKAEEQAAKDKEAEEKAAKEKAEKEKAEKEQAKQQQAEEQAEESGEDEEAAEDDAAGDETADSAAAEEASDQDDAEASAEKKDDAEQSPVEQLKESLQAMQAELKTAEAELKALTDGLDDKQKAVESASEARQKADAELAKHQQALDASVEARDRLTGLIDEHQQRVASQQRRAAYLQRQHERQTELAAEHSAAVVALRFSPAGGLLVSAHSDGSLRVYQGDDDRARDVLHGGRPASFAAAHALRFVDAQTLVWMDNAGTLLGWDVRPAWRLQHRIGDPMGGASAILDRVTAIDFHPDGRQIAVGSGPPSRSGQLLIFSAIDGQLIRELEELHSDTVLGVRFSPDGNILASSAADKVIRLVDPVDGRLIRTLEGHTHHVLGVAWHQDGVTLASASADQTVKVWDTDDGTQKRTIQGIGKEATAIRFVGSSDQVLTAGADGAVRLHNTADGKSVRSFAAAGDFLFALAVTPDGKLVLSGGQEGVLRGWNVEDGKLLAELK